MNRTGYNNLRIEAYPPGSTTLTAGDYGRPEGLRFSTIYPGGLHGEASYFVPYDVTTAYPIKSGYRLALVNGIKAVVFEGKVDTIDSVVGANRQGFALTAAGPWGSLFERGWGWDKRWADKRLDATTWAYQSDVTIYTGCEKITTDSQNRVRFTPKAELFANGEFAARRYTMPVGHTIKRLTYTYDLQGVANQWEIGAYRSTNGAAWTLIETNAVSGDTYAVGTTTMKNATATGSIDVALATPSQYLELRFYSRAAQTPKSDGTYYGSFTAVTVYSETGAINSTEILTDIVGYCTDLNSDTSNIGSNTLSLVPFIAQGTEMLGVIATRAAKFGDASSNAWAVYLRESDTATTPNGEPVLYYAQQPALTAFDYAVRMAEGNLAGDLRLTRDAGRIANWIVVTGTDPEGHAFELTPDAYGSLKDTESITAYGKRFAPGGALRLGSITTTEALAAGTRYLAQYKDPKYNLSGPVTVHGYVRGANGEHIPASEIRAGKRLRVENFLQDLSGTGLTILLTKTDYNDNAETTSMWGGVPDNQARALAALEGS